MFNVWAPSSSLVRCWISRLLFCLLRSSSDSPGRRIQGQHISGPAADSEL